MKRVCFLVTLAAILFVFGCPLIYAGGGDECQEMYDNRYKKCMDKVKKSFKRLKDGPSGKEVIAATDDCVTKATNILLKCAKLGKPFKKAWAELEEKRRTCRSNAWQSCWKEKSGDHLAFMECIDKMDVKCDWDRLERTMLLQFKN